MALIKAKIEEVELHPAPIERYADLLEKDAWRSFRDTMDEFAARMRGRVVWNVNSTARGGGVAELLAALIPYDLAAGVDERWLVIEGSPDFFEVTKKIHTFLHGVAPDGTELTEKDRRMYEATMAPNATALLEVMKAGDVAVLHDPQTAGLIPALRRQGIKVVWRSHIGIDTPNPLVRTAWKFLTPCIDGASALVFSRKAYVWDGLDAARVRVIAPCIDPFSAKNSDLTAEEATRILGASNLLARVPAEARTILQVSRWDRLKDPAGVLRAFAEHIAPRNDAWLILAGPQVMSVDDDPEQPEILADLERVCGRLDASVRTRTVLAQIPMHDIEQNAAIVNALQRRASVVVQKSLAEGFGLTVAEAMWKSRPVVAGRVGGIEDQIEHEKSGILIDDPGDLTSFGAAVVRLLEDPQRAAELGREARLRVIREYLAPRHLMQQAELLSALV